MGRMAYRRVVVGVGVAGGTSLKVINFISI